MRVRVFLFVCVCERKREREREKERERDGSNMRRLVKLSEVVASAERENDSQEHSQ